MSNEQDNTAIVAIVIALIAFVVTTAQLLQALFGTAEGFRRCQPSVIGGWYAETRRVWRWSEFRFETRFKTPHITIEDIRPGKSSSNAPQIFLTGTSYSRERTYAIRKTPRAHAPFQRTSPFDRNEEETGELASWLALVDFVHARVALHWSPVVYETGSNALPLSHHGSNSLSFPSDTESICTVTLPAVTLRTRSWDFMPPDIVRPVASSTIGDIIALAHRLGMSWKELVPGQGTMRAEGNGQSIVSTSVRGFGILLQYTHDQAVTKKDIESWRGLTVSSAEADKSGFRIIPGYERFDIPDFDFGDASELDSIKAAIDRLDIDKAVRDMYSEYFKKSNRFFGLSDLMALAAPFMPLRHSSIIRIFRPHRDAHDTPLTWYEGFVVFRTRLSNLQTEKPEEVSEQMSLVLEKVKSMNNRWSTNNGPPCWEEETRNNAVDANSRSLTFLNELREIWISTDNYFAHLESLPYPKKNKFRYRNLIAAHISQALCYPDLSNKNIAAGNKQYAQDNNFHRRYDLGPRRSPRMAEAMHLYIDRISEVEDFMEERGFGDRDIVRDAWWMLMLRAMCWHRSVSFSRDVPTGLVPSSLYRSRIPVYIA